ncbi:TetR/AcrR family transcriptional regulator [Alphaproteobacteria bacterium]|nr:TetR/AcrR family transcriptional regulator [Alphaproteobacteria bacterium]
MAKRPRPLRDRIIDAALKLAKDSAWRSISLADIAREARISLADLQKNFASKTTIVAAAMARTNTTILSEVDPSSNTEPPGDRLLDAIMCRLDALQPHKQAICSILRDMPSDPVGLLSLTPRYFDSMAWTLEAAGIGSAGLGGRLRVKGLGVIYLGALCVWARDDTQDQAKTLSFVGRRLQQAERLVKLIPDGDLFSRP